MTTDPYAHRMVAAAAVHAQAYGRPAPPEPIQDEARAGDKGRAKAEAESTDPLVNAIAARGVHRWHDFEAVAVLLPEGLVGEDGEVDSSALDAALVLLARQHPWLIKDLEMPALPLRPSGGPVGSGRKRYGLPVLDDDQLRAKYLGL